MQARASEHGWILVDEHFAQLALRSMGWKGVYDQTMSSAVLIGILIGLIPGLIGGIIIGALL